MAHQIDETVYQAAHQGAIFVDRSQLGVLKFTGKSRADLLHRMSTNQINGLQAGQGVASVLTTDIARIIDRLLLYASDDALYCLTGEGHADPVARYLMRFVFFNDDFHVENLSQQTAVYAIYGPQAHATLVAAGFPDVDLPLHHWQPVQLGELQAQLHRTDPIQGGGYFVLADVAHKEALQALFLAHGLVAADEAAFDYLRIEAGLPRHGRELTPDYIPLEANLWDDVSFKKGCYTGQEIIARMESRGKLARRLVRLQPETAVDVGANVLANGRVAGQITSLATGPNGPVALAYLKTAVLTENPALFVGDTAVNVAA